MYGMYCTRQNLVYVVNMVSQTMEYYDQIYWGTLKLVMRYFNDSLRVV